MYLRISNNNDDEVKSIYIDIIDKQRKQVTQGFILLGQVEGTLIQYGTPKHSVSFSLKR